MAVNATAVWRIRASGSNTNGGGYDPAITGAGTDYSQQAAAQLSVTDAASVATTGVVTSVTGGFTAAMVGNAMFLSGTNFTTGPYFITVFTDTNTVTVDRDPTTGGNGSAGTCKVGGGWASPAINTALGYLVPGNTVFLLGAGIPTPPAASYVPDYTISFFTPDAGTNTAGDITFATDPATPGYNGTTTGGMALIKLSSGLFNNGGQFNKFTLLWLYTQVLSQAQMTGDIGHCVYYSCVFDTTNIQGVGLVLSPDDMVIGCELFSSTLSSGNASPAIHTANPSLILGCNIHDWNGFGIDVSSANTTILHTIIAKNNGVGIKIRTASPVVANCIIDGNTGDGISISTQAILSTVVCYNNEITNHLGVGTFGIDLLAGSAAANSLVQSFVNFNTFYNNVANYNSINAGANDANLGSDPYVKQATENYTPA